MSPSPENSEQAVPPDSDSTPGQESSRRNFASTACMVAGLGAGYGFFAYIAGRFLYGSDTATQWMFVARVQDVAKGAAIPFRTPAGDTVTVARRAEAGTVDDFVALSSTCPHLGCRVHWEPQNNRFFCPCHNGVFTPDGKATGGPPAEAGQRLKTFDLEVRGDLLYILVPTERLSADAGPIEEPAGPPGPGHDPCLFPDFARRSQARWTDDTADSDKPV